MKKWFVLFPFILALLLFKGFFLNASSTDSLLTLLKTAKEDTNKANLLYQLSEIAEADEDFYEYARQSLLLSQNLNYPKGVANAYNNIGGYYYNKFDFTTALDYYKKGLQIREKIEDHFGVSQSCNNMGTVYEKQGNVVAALEHYLKGLRIREKIGAQEEVAISLDNIALFYKTQGDLTNAMAYLQKSLKIREAIKDNFGVAKSMINIGFLYQEQRDPENALQYFNKSLLLFEKIGSKQHIAMALHNIGWSYSILENYDTALGYYEKSYEILEEINDKLTMSASLNSMGNIYLKKKNYKKAEDFCLKSLEIAKVLGIPERIKNASETLSKIYAEQGQYEKAFGMQVLFKQMADSINNVTTRKSSLKKQMEYEADKKEQQISILNKDKEIQKKEIGQQTILRNTAIVISAFLLVIGFLFFNRARTNKKYSLALEEKNNIIQQEKEKAVRSELYKTQFLANMSHEIRTPLHAITGMINVLSQRSPRDDQSAYLNVMRKSSDNLIGIINNVLDISKIEAGKIDFEKIRFSPAETMDTVVNLLQANALDKGLYLKTNIIDLPDLVEGDQVRLTQVIINLIGNAIKFTGEGGVTVTGQSLKVQSGETGKCVLQFSIEDTGVGIPNDKLEKIFESFSQADEGITRKYGGTGLGLTISKQLVELQGGSIQVTSELGKGTIFSFIIPYGLVDLEDTANSVDLLLQTDALNGLNILIVEDNYYNRIVARETLNMLLTDISIEEAENGLIALEKIATNDFDFIFMDLQMPEMDGYTAMKNLRENMRSHISKSIIIGLSANSSSDEKDKCLAAGMDNYLSKPFNPKDLLKVMLETKEKISFKEKA